MSAKRTNSTKPGDAKPTKGLPQGSRAKPTEGLPWPSRAKPTEGFPWGLPRALHAHKTQVLVAGLAAVLLGLAAWLAFSPSRKPLPSDLGKPSIGDAKLPQTQSEQVLAAAAPLMKARLYGPARDLMQAYVKTNPADTRVRPMLAEALYRLNDRAAAEHMVDGLLRLDAQSPQGLWLKGMLVRDRKGENHARFFQWAAQSPQAGPDIWLRYAVDLAAAGKLDQAEEYYRKSLKGESWNVQALGGLGELLIAKGQFEEAQKVLADAVRLEKRDRDLWRMYAEALKNLAKLPEAADAIGKAIAIRRGGPELLLQAEILLLQAGQAQALGAPAGGEAAAGLRLAAAQAFASASDFPPARAEGAYKAAKVYYFLEQYAQAMRLITLARAAAPANPDIRQWEKKIEDARFPRPAATSTRPTRLLDVR